jgi:hypothetical protein
LEVTTITVLLEDECASNTGAKSGESNILKPDMPIRYEVWMGKLGKKLDFDENLL